jgi:hypothetical protein
MTMRRSLTLITLIASLITGCGTQRSVAGGPGDAGVPRARCVHLHPSRGSVTLTANSPARVCVRSGTGVYVFLHGSPSLAWQHIRSSSAVLSPRPSGIFTLMRWETAAYFLAARPGTARLISSGTGTSATRHFSVTVIVSR